jgi:hypothetical protein
LVSSLQKSTALTKIAAVGVSNLTSDGMGFVTEKRSHQLDIGNGECLEKCDDQIDIELYKVYLLWILRRIGIRGQQG